MSTAATAAAWSPAYGYLHTARESDLGTSRTFQRLALMSPISGKLGLHLLTLSSSESDPRPTCGEQACIARMLTNSAVISYVSRGRDRRSWAPHRAGCDQKDGPRTPAPARQ